MTLNIPDPIKLAAVIEDYNLNRDETLQNIVIEACYVACRIMGDESCEVQISKDLFADSYQANPPMFAVTLKNRTVFENVASFLKGEFICIVASNDSIPTTFRAKGIKAIRQFGRFESIIKEVPPSYRLRPVVFTRILHSATGLPIRAITKDKTIVWKTKQPV